MKHLLRCNSVRCWKGDSKTRIFPFSLHIEKDDKKLISGIDYRLSRRLLSGECTDVSDDLYVVNVNESFEEGILKYPKHDSLPPLLANEELILYIVTKFKEE